MANNRIKTVTLNNNTPAYDETKDVHVDDKEELSSSSLSIPTDPALRQELQRQIETTARARGINPNTGAQTPFEVLGYNPDIERKRRDAERALNDRKRKENAWYHALAMIGDSITAALGGDVYLRNPNNIGMKANADNARLITEQKAEDEDNTAKLRANGIAYANDVNNLIKNYLTKTTIKSTKGGDRHETTHHPGVSKTRQVAFPLGDSGESGGNGNKSGKGTWKNNSTYEIGLLHDGKLKYRSITGQQAKNIVNHAETLYEKALQFGDEATKKAILELLGSNIVREDDAHPGKYEWDDEALLRSGYIFEADKIYRKGILKGVDKSIRDYYREITGDNTNYDQLPEWDLVTPSLNASNRTNKTSSKGWGVVLQEEPEW